MQSDPEPSNARIEYDFVGLPGARLISFGTKVAIYDNEASARSFLAEYPDWTAKVVK
jgi:hypothetical protein